MLAFFHGVMVMLMCVRHADGDRPKWTYIAAWETCFRIAQTDAIVWHEKKLKIPPVKC